MAYIKYKSVYRNSLKHSTICAPKSKSQLKKILQASWNLEDCIVEEEGTAWMLAADHLRTPDIDLPKTMRLAFTEARSKAMEAMEWVFSR